MKSTAQLPVIGMDIAKNVFQLHVVDAETGEILRHKLKRDRVSEFFANHQPALVAMEACGGAHHWARTLQGIGHEVMTTASKTYPPLCVARQDRRTRCPRHLGGCPAAANPTSAHQERTATSLPGIAPYTRTVDEDAYHADQRLAWHSVRIRHYSA